MFIDFLVYFGVGNDADNVKCENMNNLFFSENQLIGTTAMWAIRQCPYTCPDRFEETLIALRDAARASILFEKKEIGDDGIWYIFKDIKSFRIALEEVYNTVELFSFWNLSKIEREAGVGVDDPNRKSIFCSRHDSPKADRDFIDLGALTRNIVNTFIEEKDSADKLDADFNKRHNINQVS